MNSIRSVSFLILLVACSASAAAQVPLTLEVAVATALREHPALEAARAAQREVNAGERIAGSGRLPHLSYQESYVRSNNPVFVFGSLLNQRQFTPANFEVERLNNPDSLGNFQSLLQVEQILFDFQRNRHARRVARLRSDLSAEKLRSLRADIVLNVVRTYFGAVLAREKLKVVGESVRTAQSDLRRTQVMRESGMVTRADVLSAKVHLASVQERRIRAINDLSMAQAALAEAQGLDQERGFELITPLTAPARPAAGLDDYLRLSGQERSDLRLARIDREISREQTLEARSDLWPQVVLQGALEVDRQGFASRAGGNWVAGVSLKWDIWKGSEKRHRLEARRQSHLRAEAQGRATRSQASLQVRQAFFQLSSAAQRVVVADTSVQEAAESHRIVQNRYGAELESVTELIRSQEALLDARFRHLVALHDQRVSRAALEHATGRLTASSEALK